MKPTMWLYYSCGIVLAFITLVNILTPFRIASPFDDPERFLGAAFVLVLMGYGSWWLLSHAEAIRIKGCEA
jgi:bacteriorhodopsin